MTEKTRSRGLFGLRSKPSKDSENEIVGADPIPLADGYLACGICGIAVPTPADKNQILDVHVSSGATPAGQPFPDQIAELATCEPCQRLIARSAEIVSSHPRMQAKLGPLKAWSLTRGVLIAFDVLKHPAPDVETSDEILSAAIRHLGAIGHVLQWQVRLTPDTIATASPGRFATIGEDDRARLRSGFAEMLREKIAMSAPAARLSPPALNARDFPELSQHGTIPVPHGCLLCGVGSIARPARQVTRDGGTERARALVWTGRTMNLQSLGGRASPAKLVGHVCPRCEDAIQTVGATGPTALETALTRHIGAGQYDMHRDVISGLRGWGALAANAALAHEPPPDTNATPWSHVNGLELIASDLGAKAGEFGG